MDHGMNLDVVGGLGGMRHVRKYFDDGSPVGGWRAYSGGRHCPWWHTIGRPHTDLPFSSLLPKPPTWGWPEPCLGCATTDLSTHPTKDSPTAPFWRSVLFLVRHSLSDIHFELHTRRCPDVKTASMRLLHVVPHMMLWRTSFFGWIYTLRFLDLDHDHLERKCFLFKPSSCSKNLCFCTFSKISEKRHLHMLQEFSSCSLSCSQDRTGNNDCMVLFLLLRKRCWQIIVIIILILIIIILIMIKIRWWVFGVDVWTN